MISLTRTVYGNIELDFNNTKIIRNGKIMSLDEAENPDNEGATLEQLAKAKEMQGQNTSLMQNFENRCNDNPEKPVIN